MTYSIRRTDCQTGWQVVKGGKVELTSTRRSSAVRYVESMTKLRKEKP